MSKESPDKRQQVRDLFDAALARPLEERARFLDLACARDEALRREVDSLLAADQDSESFMETPAVAGAAQSLLGVTARLATGQQISHYKIMRWMGEGGMGEVYLAQDISLGSNVALKLLPDQFAADADRLRRFKQEARSASALNHPNILTVHEMGQDQGKHYIATEFIDGVTLGQKLADGPLKLPEALDIACQVALALTAAHEAKIIHRDIKPENIMLRRDHIVKVLDFGLAKLTETMPVAHDAEAPTKALLKTAPGRFMGTVKYSSPEQVQAIELDARTDIWSLGVVLYEMVTGSEPFSGNTANHVCVAILEKEPTPLANLAPGAPPELQRIVRKTLAKERDERYQTARDLLIDLKSLKQDLEFAARLQHSAPPELSSDETRSAEVNVEATREVSRQTNEARAARTTLNAAFPKRKALLWTAALLSGLLLVAVGIALYEYLRGRSAPPPRIGSTVQLTNDGRQKTYETILTDGSRVYFAEDIGQTLGFAQVPTTGGEASMIPANFLEVPHQGFLFDISLDRNELLVAKDEHDGNEPTLWTMSVLGGAGRRLGDLRGHSACWSPDAQQIAYANGRDLYIAKSDGTESRKLVTPPVSGIPMFPSWSPDGTRLRFNVVDFVKEISNLWEEAVDGTGLHRLLPGWKGKAGNDGWGGRWTPDGRYYVFLVGSDLGAQHGANLWALRETTSLLGKADREPIQLTYGPLSFFPPVFSPDGKRLFSMAYMPHGEVMRYDVPTEHWGPLLSGTSAINLDFSRDGQWVTYVTYPKGPLWRSRADGRQRLQLTSPEVTVSMPRWSPDGKQIAFGGQVSGQPYQIFVVSAEGGKAEQVVQTNCADVDPTWSADGNKLVFGHLPPFEAPCKAEIYVLDLKSRQVSTIPGSDGLFSPRWSPDGNSIVAVTADFSRLMLFSFATQRWEELAKRPPGYPGWSRDGRFVYFMDDNDVLRVRIADHKMEQVVSLKDVRLKIGYTGLSLAPDDSPLLLFETSVKELYALDWIAP